MIHTTTKTTDLVLVVALEVNQTAQDFRPSVVLSHL